MLFATEIDRNRTARQASSTRIHDVDYRDLTDDPIRAISTLYDSLRMPVAPAFRTALTAYARSYPMGRHGTHRYSLNDGHIDVDQVERRLAS